jgi:MATE family multidrug resistance protein
MIVRRISRRWRGPGGYHQLLAIAMPLILSTGAWSVQHFVDRMFLAWYSPEAIAASMPAGILCFAVISLFMGTASYVSTFVAQYYGAGRFHRIGPSIWQGIYVSIFGGVVILALIPFAGAIFDFVGHVPAVRQLEKEYFQILCLGGGFVIASAAISGFFSGLGRSWPIMWVNCAATCLNLVLDYALIFGNWGLPEMGIRGAGYATVIASIFSVAFFMFLISRKGYNKSYNTLAGWRLEKGLFRRLLYFGFPSGIQFFLDISGFTVFILIIGRLGMGSLAASNIAFNISTLAFMPMIGCGIAISVLVGQYLGKELPHLAQKSVYSGFHIAFIYMAGIAILYLFVPAMFIRPFSALADPDSFKEIYGLSVILLRFVAIYSVFDAMNIVFSSAIKGAGDTRFVMYTLAVMTLFMMILPTYFAVIVLGYGLMICWLFASVYIMCLGLLFFLRFRSGKWKGMRVIERRLDISRIAD